ncbi:Uncharacterized protein TCM_041335 [Theobroma cacao]|uniref:Uncharacterized protein n=1 Tax=Theobroma cacao TaxID=3641 RepID=A0A061GU28_THECC|nr:Uncharacterized protein TCM_041335 [Theobroma cacao]
MSAWFGDIELKLNRSMVSLVGVETRSSSAVKVDHGALMRGRCHPHTLPLPLPLRIDGPTTTLHFTSLNLQQQFVGKLGPDPKTLKCNPESQPSLWAELNLFPLSQRRCEKGYLPPLVRTTEKRATWSKMRVILNGRGLSVTKVKLTSVLETCYVPKRKSLK